MVARLRYSASMTTQASPFGARLRQWRQHRGLSQLSLAGQVGSTGRHISFLETGRSRPSRQMVLRLADILGIGLRDTNDLLHAAGLPADYPTAGLDSSDLAPYRAAVDRMLAAHEPYPGMVLDRHWTVVAANRPCQALFGPTVVGINFVRDALTNPANAQAIVNWPEVAWAGLDRLRNHQRRRPFDPELAQLVTVAEAALAGVSRPEPATPHLLVCPWFRIGDQVIRTIAMVAQFDHPAETTLDELRVELMYPMDDTAERFFRRMSGHTDGTAATAARDQIDQTRPQ
jgi:transcriptional regulator with XRE-family HTH domain